MNKNSVFISAIFTPIHFPFNYQEAVPDEPDTITCNEAHKTEDGVDIHITSEEAMDIHGSNGLADAENMKQIFVGVLGDVLSNYVTTFTKQEKMARFGPRCDSDKVRQLDSTEESEIEEGTSLVINKASYAEISIRLCERSRKLYLRKVAFLVLI